MAKRKRAASVRPPARSAPGGGAAALGCPRLPSADLGCHSPPRPFPAPPRAVPDAQVYEFSAPLLGAGTREAPVAGDSVTMESLAKGKVAMIQNVATI